MGGSRGSTRSQCRKRKPHMNDAKAVPLLLGIACHWVLLSGHGLQKLPAEAAGARVGKVVTICGMAIDLGCDAPDPTAVVTLLTPYLAPTFGVAIAPEDRSRFGLQAEDRYVPRHLCVTGEIERSQLGYRVSVSRADQLHFDIESQPAPAPLAEALYRSCDAGVVPPKLLRTVHAHYTPEAMRARVEGSVFLQGVVGRDGSMRDVQVLRSLDLSTLDEATVRAFKQWRFRPGTRLGKEVSVIVTAQMAFIFRRNRTLRYVVQKGLPRRRDVHCEHGGRMPAGRSCTRLRRPRGSLHPWT